MNNQFKEVTQKIKWKVYNKEFKHLKSFSYSNFKFRFLIESQELQEQFADLIDVAENKALMPWDICKFLIENSIKYKIGFVYNRNLNIKDNWIMFKIYIPLLRQQHRLNKTYIVKAFKESENNIHKIGIRIINTKKMNMLVLMISNDFCIKIDKYIHDSDKSKGVSLSWLSMNLIYLKVK